MEDRYRIILGSIYEYNIGSYIHIGKTIGYNKKELSAMKLEKVSSDHEIEWDEEI